MNLPVPASGAGGSVPSQLKSLMGAMSDWQGKLDSLAGDFLSRLQAALTLGQATRLLQLETNLPSGTLVVERIRVTEAVHADEPLWADIDCISTSAYLALKAITVGPRILRKCSARSLPIGVAISSSSPTSSP